MGSEATLAIEQQTGGLYGQLWPHYDDKLFLESVGLFEKRWKSNGEPTTISAASSSRRSGAPLALIDLADDYLGAW